MIHSKRLRTGHHSPGFLRGRQGSMPTTTSLRGEASHTPPTPSTPGERPTCSTPRSASFIMRTSRASSWQETRTHIATRGARSGLGTTEQMTSSVLRGATIVIHGVTRGCSLLCSRPIPRLSTTRFAPRHACTGEIVAGPRD